MGGSSGMKDEAIYDIFFTFRKQSKNSSPRIITLTSLITEYFKRLENIENPLTSWASQGTIDNDHVNYINVRIFLYNWDENIIH